MERQLLYRREAFGPCVDKHSSIMPAADKNRSFMGQYHRSDQGVTRVFW